MYDQRVIGPKVHHMFRYDCSVVSETDHAGSAERAGLESVNDSYSPLVVDEHFLHTLLCDDRTLTDQARSIATMIHFRSARWKKWLHRDGGSQNTAPPPHQADQCTNDSPASECTSAPYASECQSQPRNPQPLQDLWKSAFDLLSREERNALQTNLVSSSTTATLNDVIETTREKYEIYQEKGGIRIRKSTGEEVNIRKISKKIINATLSFKEVISAGVACDPTGHAASAWAIVSLGLTVCVVGCFR